MPEYLGFDPAKGENYYFISYNSDDSERLTGILSLMNASSIPLWYDYGLNYVGDEWLSQIGAKIEKCKALLLFVTRNMFSKAGTVVETEYRIAKNKCHKDIYTIVLDSLDDKDIPYSMYDWWLEMRRHRCLDAWKYTDGVSLLKEILNMLQIIEPQAEALHVSPSIKNYPENTEPPTTELSRENTFRSCEMLIRLEEAYQSNSRHIFVFNELDRASRDLEYSVEFTEDPLDLTKINPGDIVLYFTFFESLYRTIKRGILSIDEVDDCFSDRFFKFIHHSYIQKKELYQVPSTYANIFELYGIWKKYHVSNMTGPSQIAAFLENEIPDFVIDEKIYAQECWNIGQRNYLENRIQKMNLMRKPSSPGDKLYKQFSFRRLYPQEIREIIDLQNEVVKGLEDPDLFVESTKHELLESMLIDFCYGLYDGDVLAAICVIVLNRESPRNLITSYSDVVNRKWSERFTPIDCLTFDSIQVRREYQGYGIQSFFLSVAEKLAKMVNAKCIMASVSPANVYSRNNFFGHKYSVVTTERIEKAPYGGRLRDVVVKVLRDE